MLYFLGAVLILAGLVSLFVPKLTNALEDLVRKDPATPEERERGRLINAFTFIGIGVVLVLIGVFI